MKRLLIFVISFFITVSAVNGEESFPDFKFNALLEGRLALTDDDAGWLEDGLGKTRYGSGSTDNNQHHRTVLKLAEASFILRSQLSWPMSAYLHLKTDQEQHHVIDMVEAYVQYKPLPKSSFHFNVRAGAFFPPLSYENEGMAWTNEYTISNSAINAWIGEEVRTIGIESRFSIEGEDSVWRAWFALFGANDGAGTLLVWRGWAIHDRETGIFDRLPLPALPAFRHYESLRSHHDVGIFKNQVRWLEPYHELDNKIGAYSAVEFEHLDYGRIRAFFYNNFADERVFDGEQYAWRTKFLNLSLELALPLETTFISQYMLGNTLMGNKEKGVYADYWSFFSLISKTFGSHRLSGRFDRFNVDDRDRNGILDDNSENGYAYTLAYLLNFKKHHHIMAEFLYVKSDRPARSSMGWDAHISESQFQIGYRFTF